MTTYAHGYTLEAEKDITKNDIINICKLLNTKYDNGYTFKPEAITEGGIVYNFNNGNTKWYKTVRLRVDDTLAGGKWYWITDNVMNEWEGNDDVILSKNKKILIFLKSFHGAPVFTVDELKIWEECFNQNGFIRKSKYPTNKQLNTNDFNTFN